MSGKAFQKVYGYDKGRLNNVTYNTGSTGSLTQLAKTVNMYNTNGYVYRLEDGNNNRYWEINNVNAAGQETDMLLGNGLSTLKSFSPEGSCTSIKTYNKAGNSNIYQDMAFNFNSITGTLVSRTDNVHQLNESFTYDGLLRLTANGPTAYRQTLEYENNGNIKTKSDVGTGSLFNYSDTSKPYTLSNITGVSSSNLTNQLDIDYTVMSRPTTITNSTTGQIATFMYNDDYDRSYMQLENSVGVSLVKYYFSQGQYEVETMSGTDKQRLFLDGTPYTANVVIEKSGANAAQLYYIHRDYLGSITQITDNSANLAAEYSYDAWGRMRDVNSWLPYAQGAQPALLLGRGYTGHEHLSQFGVINMNARLYDPMLARFLAADPKISSSFSNDFNRYVYCRNNPLMYTDPSGKSWESFKAWWVRNISKPFFAECENVYRNGIMFGVSTNTGFSSATGFVALPNGPGIGLQTSNFKNYTPVGGNYQGGFFNSQPLGLEGRMQQSVVQAEQKAKNEYWNTIVQASTSIATQMLWDKIGNPDIVTISPINVDAGIANIQASGKWSLTYMRIGEHPGWYSQLSGGGTLGIVSPSGLKTYFNVQENLSVTFGVTLGWIAGGDKSKVSSEILNGASPWSFSAGAGEGLYGAGSFSFQELKPLYGGGYLISVGVQVGIGEGGRLSVGYSPTYSTDAARMRNPDY